jgi:hypothetical protein
MEEWDEESQKDKELKHMDDKSKQPTETYIPVSNSNQTKQTNEWKIAGARHTMTREVEHRFLRVGIKLVRVGKRGATTYHPQDIAQFFREIQRIDPNAIILNHHQDRGSAKTVEDMATGPTMEFAKFLDMRTDSWGGPSEQKSRTMWMCYIASDMLTPNLQVLRNDIRINQYLQNGNISLQFTKLEESNSRIVFHVANKDPTHTNRLELEERLGYHITRFSTKKIHIHLLNMEVNP